jgi:ABC-2 type transport system ATP-binding protein
MTVLIGRFREVTVTLVNPSPLPANLPATWLQSQTADCVVRFVHSEFKEQESQREVAERFPSARDIYFDPMSLRSIFLAIAKTGRNRTLSAQAQNNAEEKLA